MGKLNAFTHQWVVQEEDAEQNLASRSAYFLFLLKKACYFPDSSFCTDHMRVELTLLLERSHRFGALGMESVCHSGRHTTRFNCCALNSPLPACVAQ